MDSAVPPDEKRILIELEFVQNLSNVKYLHYLALNKYFDDPAFMRFLEYLQYWKEPQYSKYLLFPQSLAFLDALVYNTTFRRELVFPQFVDFVHRQQGLHWQYSDTSKP